MKNRYFFAALITLVLTACGGGGGGTTNADPQGIWTGQISTGFKANMVLLENGELFGIYSTGSTIYGAGYGTASVSGNAITISGTDFYFPTNSATKGTFTGTVTTKSAISLTNANSNVALSYVSQYDTAATAVAVTGNWSFIGRSGSYTLLPGSISVNSLGAFTLNQTNCVTSGSIVPRSSGKNVYNVTLTSVGSSCAVGQSSMAGVAYLDTSVTPNRFLSLALTASKGDGLIVIGTRQ